MRRALVAVLALVPDSLVLGRPIRPDGAPRGRITARGVGRATARAARLELAAVVRAEGDLAADALSELAEARRRARAAFAASGFEGLEVESTGAVVEVVSRSDALGRRAAWRGPRVRARDELRVRVAAGEASTEELAARLLDCALDAGLSVPERAVEGGSPSSSVRVLPADPEALEREAIAAAARDARRRAARVAGSQLGAPASAAELELRAGSEAPGAAPALIVHLSVAFGAE